MGEGHTYGFGAVGGARFKDPIVGRLERFRRRFAEFGAPVPAYLAALQSDEQLHFGAIEWVEVDEWHRGRVVLLGDAAHAPPCEGHPPTPERPPWPLFRADRR